jgi:Ca2+-binding RTX toxin-like protein
VISSSNKNIFQDGLVLNQSIDFCKPIILSIELYLSKFPHQSHTIIMKTQYLDLVKSQLFQLATLANFESILTTAFGTNIAPQKIRQLRKQWLMGNFSVIPPIEVLAQGELGIASGGYAAAEDKIFISADFLAQQQGNPQAITGLLLEEIGHKLDRVFNGHIDSPGDEGEIFSRLVSGQNLSAATLATLRAEDDRALITVGRKAVSIEQEIIIGTAGSDTLIGTPDSDSISGGAGIDFLDGRDGNDFLSGGLGNDLLNGDNGNDTLYGGFGDDSLYGGFGNDLLRGETGDDLLEGEAGNDNLFGDAGSDTLRGGSGNDTIFGGDNNDILIGGADSDYLVGDNGNDALFGGTGNDILNGGDGNDNLFSGDDNDALLGGNGDDVLWGEAGNDRIFGEAGNDILLGGTGDDRLDGMSGDDSLAGTDGNDTIYGGSGNDTLNGGTGNDLFYFTSFSPLSGLATVANLVGRDTVVDFVTGLDKIVLSQSTFTNVTATGNGSILNFATVANDAAALSGTSSAAILYSSSTGNLFYNQNGTLAGLGNSGGNFATLSGLPTLAASDFLIE